MELKSKILLVDDAVKYHRLYEMAITSALPAEVECVENGQLALEKLSDRLYDLAILDLDMPVMSGDETLARIRKTFAPEALPVLMLTAQSDSGTQERLFGLGADDFVAKSSPPEILISRIKSLLKFKATMDRLMQVTLDLDIFAAGVVHDIRNVEMTALSIIELQELMRSTGKFKRDEFINDLKALEDRARKLKSYATDIIEIARHQDRPLQQADTDLEESVEWARKLASRIGKGDPLSVSFDSELTNVLADPHFLRLVILNILQNSVKYCLPGVTPRVSVTQTKSTNGKSVITRFKDNGRGISADELQKIFLPFYRSDQASTIRIGYGLGLALVAKAIANMRGRVWAESDGDKTGTTIAIELPSPETETDGA